MSGDDIVDELRFRVTVTRLGGQHTAREVMSDIMAMENARAEIVRLRAEVERKHDYACRMDALAEERLWQATRLWLAGDALAERVADTDYLGIASDVLQPWQEARRG